MKQLYLIVTLFWTTFHLLSVLQKLKDGIAGSWSVKFKSLLIQHYQIKFKAIGFDLSLRRVK